MADNSNTSNFMVVAVVVIIILLVFIAMKQSGTALVTPSSAEKERLLTACRAECSETYPPDYSNLGKSDGGGFTYKTPQIVPCNNKCEALYNY